MAITDEQFTEWLREQGTSRVVLAVLHPFSGGEVVSHYIGNRDFVTRSTDTPALQHFEGILSGAPVITRRMNDTFIGEATSSWGDLEVRNSNGTLDSWLEDKWDGRALEVYIGDMAWEFADFRLLFSGVIADIFIKDDSTIAFRIRDKRHILDRPVQSDLIEGTGTVNDGEPKPLCFGYCYNIEPRLINAATHEYMAHSGTNISSSSGGMRDVRDNGVAVSATFGGTVWDGTFELLAAPVGRVTMDLRGGRSTAGLSLFWLSSILEELTVGRGVIDAADVDPDFFDTLFTKENIFGIGGYYVRDRKNLIDVMNEFSEALLFWYGFSRAGLLTGGFLGGDSVLTIEEDDVKVNGLRHIGRLLPWTRARIGYYKNWTIQDPDSLAGSVVAADREKWASEFNTILARDNILDVSDHLMAEEPPMLRSLFTTDGAQTGSDSFYGPLELANRLMGRQPSIGGPIPGLFSQLQNIYQLDTTAVGFDLELGNTITLQYPRYGFDAGETAIVTGITLRPMESTVSLELLK